MNYLRDYQQRALDLARQALNDGRRAPLIVAPTGVGKTRIAAEACFRHAELGGQPLFVAPRRELIDQARKTLRERGLDLPWVRTIQELTQPGAEVPPATLVVLDEARHYVSECWSQLRERLPDAYILGLDATPERGDGVGLGGMFDCLIEAISIQDAIAQGHLVPADILRPERSLGSNELAIDPIEAFVQYGGSHAVIFAKSVEVSVQYACALRERGYRAAAVWGEMPTAQRDRILSEYAAGEIRVLTNANLLTEGWDAAITDTIVLARGFGTPGGYLQAVGRGLRLYPKKTKCIVLDLRGVSHLHGEVDEPRTWHLDGKACRRAKDDPNLRYCVVCGGMLSVEDVACPECGREGTHRMRPPRVLGLPIDRYARKRRETDEERAATLVRYQREARARNFKPGWAYVQFKVVYGESPSAEVQRIAKGATRAAS